MTITRRCFFHGALTVAAGGMLASCSSSAPSGAAISTSKETPETMPPQAAPTQPERQLLLYAGTYTRPGAPGIYRYRLNPTTGELALLESASAGANPSFLAFHPNGKYLYAVNELDSGLVSAFALDAQSGQLTPLNQQSSHGSAPCHLATDRQGKFLLVANYVSGSLSVYELEADGRIGKTIQTLQHEGRSVNSERQEGPHAHYVTATSDNRFVLCCDLGLDKVLVYQLDPDSGQLTLSSEAVLQPGAGPRHLAFHPTERYAYVINELDSSMTVFTYAAETGRLTELQTLSTLPEGYTGENSTAEIWVHPSGRFVYGSNRGHDSIVIYSVEEATGTLTLVGHTSTQGKSPRSFIIAPSGTLLLAANQDSDTVINFRLDPKTGHLSDLAMSVELPQPVCLVFWNGEGHV
jgi:6-phosphogluconolactonase